MNDNPVLTESTYYILLSLYTPQHGYGIMQRTEALTSLLKSLQCFPSLSVKN